MRCNVHVYILLMAYNYSVPFLAYVCNDLRKTKIKNNVF